MTYTTLHESPFHILRLAQGGSTYRLQEFTDQGLHQLELSEAELRGMLEALPVRLLYDALVRACPNAHEHLSENPFFAEGGV